MYDTGIYTASAGKRNKMISNSILSAMNNDISKVRKQGDIYECEGTFFTAEQIPKISGTSLNEIKRKIISLTLGRISILNMSPVTDRSIVYTQIIRG